MSPRHGLEARCRHGIQSSVCHLVDIFLEDSTLQHGSNVIITTSLYCDHFLCESFGEKCPELLVQQGGALWAIVGNPSHGALSSAQPYGSTKLGTAGPGSTLSSCPEAGIDIPQPIIQCALHYPIHDGHAINAVAFLSAASTDCAPAPSGPWHKTPPARPPPRQ